jgi:hypothetical protein
MQLKLDLRPQISTVRALDDLPLVGIIALELEETLDGASEDTSSTRAPM